MNADRRRAFVALTAAGVLWGTTVPLSKLALGWLPPGWLTLARFSIAAAILMPAARGRLRRACRPALLAATVTVAQARLLRDHDPIAMTAAQFLGAAAGVLRAGVLTESIPSRQGSVAAVLAVAGLV